LDLVWKANNNSVGMFDRSNYPVWFSEIWSGFNVFVDK
jgi:hypothetical protein